MGNRCDYSKVSVKTSSLEYNDDNDNDNDNDSDSDDDDKKINDSLFLSVMNNNSYISLKILEYLEKNVCPENFNKIINYTDFYFNIEKSSILLYASENKMKLLLTKLLYDLPNRNICHIDIYGNTLLLSTCLNQLSSNTLCILNNVERCNLSYVNNYGETALTISCQLYNEDIIMKILEYPEKCNMGCMTKEIKSEEIKSIDRKYYEKYRVYYEKYGFRWSSFNETALILSCKYKLNKSALKMLDYPNLCNIYAISSTYSNSVYNYKKYTSLVWACENNLDEVALKILNYPQEEFYKRLDLYQGAFEHACKNNMETVVIKFMDESNKLLIINSNVLYWFNKNKMDNAINFYIKLSFDNDIL